MKNARSCSRCLARMATRQLALGSRRQMPAETKKPTVAAANIVQNGIFKTKADAAIGPLKIF